MLSMQEYAAAAAAGAREYAAGWREWHIAGSRHLLYAGEHHNDMCCAMMTGASAHELYIKHTYHVNPYSPDKVCSLTLKM